MLPLASEQLSKNHCDSLSLGIEPGSGDARAPAGRSGAGRRVDARGVRCRSGVLAPFLVSRASDEQLGTYICRNLSSAARSHRIGTRNCQFGWFAEVADRKDFLIAEA
jgi:hypothetical protein